MNQDKQPIALGQTYQYMFTVFTPTYNRAHTLHRVYESLKAQTFRDFEWLIVDDGSTDNTNKLVEQWQQEAEFPIRYIYQKNSGKHIACNRGVQEAKGELFLTFDSDDACLPKALERLKYHWDTIPVDQKEKFAAVTCLCTDQNGEIVGNYFSQNVIDSDAQEIRYKFKVYWEMWGFNRTDVMKQFPFPVIEGQPFVPEGVVWGAIASKYKTRYVNEALRIYWVANGSTAQLTSKTNSPAKYAVSHILCHRQILNEEIAWFRWAPKEFFRSAVHYIRFSLHAQESLFSQVIKLKTVLAKFIWLCMIPVGYLVYAKDIQRNSRREK